MEEDINNLKEIVDLCEKEIKNNNYNTTATLDITDLKSIDNLLNELERLQKKNERLIERNIKYDETLEKLQKETIWRFKIQNKIEELEKNKNKLDEINETTRLYSPYDTYDFQINILKELLGDE